MRMLPVMTLAALSCFALAAKAQQKAPSLTQALAELREAPALEYARLGVIVRDGEERLLAHNDEMGFMTASNMKLFSAAVALRVLGPKFRFTTRLEARGRIVGGTLYGDLVLVGSGDPSLGATHFEKKGSTEAFRRLIPQLNARGLRHVSGGIGGDDSIQADRFMGPGWEWSDHADWYAAPVGGLCFNENCLDFVFEGRTTGQLATYTLQPDTAYFEIHNELRSIAEGSGTGPLFDRRIGSRVLRVHGTIGQGRRNVRDWAAVDEPARFAATVLRETLAAGGIAISGEPFGPLDGPRPARGGSVLTVAEHRSPPMAELTKRLLTTSQNLYAEQLLRRAALERGHEMSIRGGRKLAEAELSAMGIDTTGFRMADASGLSRLNLVQPRHVEQLLVAMLQSEHAALWREALPLAGRTGTLRRRFGEGHPAHARVQAKTGYISRVVALSGYVPREGREPLVFVVLVNDFLGSTRAVQKAVDRFVGQLCVLADNGAQGG
jgi:D-alanyl-D-alanine carboxypeptidase/D-alanyl-D-alanine-endopeptidase (penicillin-binding protein 4)